jgi:tripartite-type tricarboxylate transporter receptor subunit TctC
MPVPQRACTTDSPESARLRRRNFLRLIGGSAIWQVVSAVESAEAYPSRPITFVVPYPTGGGADVIARVLAETMRGALGQPVIVENTSGAAGNIGAGRVARASPDGYAIVIGNWSTHVVNAAVYALQFDPFRDFEPVALVGTAPWLIVGRKGLAAGGFQELVAWLKANPEQATVGTAGVGSGEHISGILFEQVTGTRVRFIPYRGAALAMQDLVAGRIDLMLTGPIPALPQLRAGAITAYAVTSQARLPQVPEAPTAEELGVPYRFAFWHAVWAPKGTPRSIIGKLNSAVAAALADPGTRRRLADLGLNVSPPELQTPEALAALHRAEAEKWWPLIKAANIRLD